MRPGRRWAGVAWALCAATLAGAAVRPVPVPGGQAPRVYGAAAVGVRAQYSHLGGMLAGLAAAGDPATWRGLNPALRLRVQPPHAPEVLVQAVAAGDPRALVTALHRLGGRGLSTWSNLVGGWVPVAALPALDALPELRLARAALPRRRAASGPVALQGDFVQGSYALRQGDSTLDGSGVTVGALSDSFDCYATYAAQGPTAMGTNGYNGYATNGFTASYADDQSNGALPAGIDVLEEASCESYGAPQQPPFGDEGRAILQIVHVVAPAARLAFHTAVESESDFANGIVQLQQLGAKVIDDDVGYPDEPFFQDGVVAQAIDQVEADGVAYFSSAGNDGRNSWESAAPQFVTVGSQQLLNFDTSGAGTATTLALNLPAIAPGEWVVLVLQWDQPFITGAPDSGGSRNALNLCIESASVNADQVAQSDGSFQSVTYPLCAQAIQIGADPLQVLIVGNPADAPAPTAAQTIDIQVALTSGAAPGRVKFLLSDNGLGASIPDYATDSPTIQGHPGAAGAITVGAAMYYQSPACGTTPAMLETFSSWGGDPILFDSSGNRLATPQQRAKPDLVGPDGINDTFLGFTLQSSTFPSPPWNPATGLFDTQTPQCQNDAAYPNFFGTSAAAPHAAGIAALMLQSNPTLTPAQIRTALTGTALAMGSADASGAGFVQAQAAYQSLPAAPAAAAPATGAGAIDGLTLLVLGAVVWRTRQPAAFRVAAAARVICRSWRPARARWSVRCSLGPRRRRPSRAPAPTCRLPGPCSARRSAAPAGG